MTDENKKELTFAERKQLSIKGFINSVTIQNRIKSYLGDPQKVAKFTSTLINVALDEQLINCSEKSIINAGLQAAELDLSLNKNMGLAYIVKYRSDAEFQVGYKGWQLLAKRAGIKLNATPIFDCDQFELFSDGFDTTVKYIPNLDEQKEFEPEWVNSHLKGVLVSFRENDEISHKFVSAGKIMQIAGMSKTKNATYSPYSTWNLEMYIAKAIKYVLSKLPMNEQISKAIEIENESDKARIETVNNAVNKNKTDDGIITVVSEEDFALFKQNIINKETTLQDLCDSGFEFSREQYDELERLENELQAQD